MAGNLTILASISLLRKDGIECDDLDPQRDEQKVAPKSRKQIKCEGIPKRCQTYSKQTSFCVAMEMVTIGIGTKRILLCAIFLFFLIFFQFSSKMDQHLPNPTVLVKNTQAQFPQIPFDPWRRIYAPWMAEFMGTMFFVLFSNLLGTLLVENSRNSLADIALLEAALLLGLILVFGPFSGGHFNPAITLGAILCLGTPILLGISLLFAQFFGAFIGALLFRAILSNSAFLDSFSRLGIIRVLSSSAGGQDGDEGDTAMRLPILVTNGLAQDGRGMPSPFANRFQVFLVELLISSLLVLAFLFPTLILRRPKILPASLCCASARSIASTIGSRSPLGQSANLARALVNSLLAAIFTKADEFAVWRLFHLHLFGAICSAIVGAAIFWIFKYALNAAERAEMEANLRAEMQNVGNSSSG